MKQFIYILPIWIFIAGCSNNSNTAGKESKSTVTDEQASSAESNSAPVDMHEVNVDTLGMAEFLAMKAAEAARNKSSERTLSNDITDINDDIVVDTTGFATYKRLKAETARQEYDDSIRRAEILANRRETIKNAERNASTRDSRTGSTARTSGETNATTTPDNTEVAKTTPDSVKEKKGWSKKAKGAVIGAATGAAAGAVINKKNRGVGGVVGGVVGAAAGYGIGRHKDKKDAKEEEKKGYDLPTTMTAMEGLALSVH